jgi:hypothetical protein
MRYLTQAVGVSASTARSKLETAPSILMASVSLIAFAGLAAISGRVRVAQPHQLELLVFIPELTLRKQFDLSSADFVGRRSGASLTG